MGAVRSLVAVACLIASGCGWQMDGTKRATYDIDVVCNDVPIRCDPKQLETCDDQTVRLSCYSPDVFHISCDRRTIQILDDTKTLLCTSQDHKSIRIRRVTAGQP